MVHFKSGDAPTLNWFTSCIIASGQMMSAPSSVPCSQVRMKLKALYDRNLANAEDTSFVPPAMLARVKDLIGVDDCEQDAESDPGRAAKKQRR